MKLNVKELLREKEALRKRWLEIKDELSVYIIIKNEDTDYLIGRYSLEKTHIISVYTYNGKTKYELARMGYYEEYNHGHDYDFKYYEYNERDLFFTEKEGLEAILALCKQDYEREIKTLGKHISTSYYANEYQSIDNDIKEE